MESFYKDSISRQRNT